MRSRFSKRYLKTALLISALTFAGCAAKPLPVEDTKWATHLGDFARTGVSTSKIDVPLVIGWDKGLSEFRFLNPFPGEELSSPAILNGRIYAGSTGRELFAR